MFKVGDDIKLPSQMCSGGKVVKIEEIKRDGYQNVTFVRFRRYADKYQDTCGASEHLVELNILDKSNNNQNTMNILEKFKLLGLGEPEKTFRILGIQNDKGELTGEGKALYEAWRFEQDKKDFSAAVCTPLMTELEKEKK